MNPNYDGEPVLTLGGIVINWFVQCTMKRVEMLVVLLLAVFMICSAPHLLLEFSKKNIAGDVLTFYFFLLLLPYDFLSKMKNRVHDAPQYPLLDIRIVSIQAFKRFLLLKLSRISIWSLFYAGWLFSTIYYMAGFLYCLIKLDDDDNITIVQLFPMLLLFLYCGHNLV